MRRRLLSLLLVISLILSLPGLAYAKTVEEPNDASDDEVLLPLPCGPTLQWVISDELLKIDGTGVMDHYQPQGQTGTTAPWYAQQGFWNAAIAEGATEIGAYAFAGLEGLYTVYLPASLTAIADNAFLGCSNLTAIYYAGTQAQWDAVQVGSGNDLLQEAVMHPEYPGTTYALTIQRNGGSGVVPDGLYRPGYVLQLPTLSKDRYALTGWSDGQTKYPTGLFTMPAHAVTLTAQWEESQAVVAQGTCGSALTWVLLENGDLQLNGTGSMYDYSAGAPAPWQANALQILTVTLGPGVEQISPAAFLGCDSLTAFRVDPANPHLTAVDGILLDGTKTHLVRYPTGKPDTEALPQTITAVDAEAFSGCKSLTRIALPAGVSSIGTAAFENCRGLVYLVLPEAVTTVPPQAFRHCVSLISAALGTQLTALGDSAFADCGSLKELNLPLSLTNVGANCFDQCFALKNVHYAGTEVQRQQIVIQPGSPVLTNAAWHWQTGALLPDDAAAYRLLYRQAADGISVTGYVGCPTGALLIPAEMEGKPVTEIASRAFWFCPPLPDIERDPDDDHIQLLIANSDAKFSGTLELPDTVKRIGSEAFSNNYLLTGTLDLPLQLQALGYAAFEGCFGLTDLKIPGTVSSIEANAFLGCTGLTNVYFDGGQAQWDKLGYTFDGTPSMHFTGVSFWVLHYDLQDGTGSFPDASYVPGTSILLPTEAPVRAGYLFTGWSDGTAVYPAGSSFSMPDHDVTLTAQWQLITHTLSFEPDGGSGSFPAQELAPGTEVTLPVDAPARDGHLFTGWSDGSAVYPAGSGFSMPDHDVTLTAQWQLITHALSFELNGGSGSFPAQELAPGTEMTLPVEAPARDGHLFTGWSDGSAVYPAGSSFSMPDHDVTLTAQWQLITHALSFELNGGSGSFPAQELAPGTQVTLPVDAPARDGYVFTGWSDGTAVYKAGAVLVMPNSDLVFRAQWRPLPPQRPFTLGTDNNSFSNHNATFYDGFYQITKPLLSDKTFNRVTAGMTKGERSAYQMRMNDNWDGNCFGIASTMALVYDSRLALTDLMPGSLAATYNALPKPWTNRDLLDALLYYQMSQYDIIPTATSLYTFFENPFQDVLSYIIETTGLGYPLVMGYCTPKYGHAILLLQSQKQADGSYHITFYDENTVGTTGFGTIWVSSDFNRFRFLDFVGTEINETYCTYIACFDTDNLDIMKPHGTDTPAAASVMDAADTMHLTVSNRTGYTITAHDGTTLHYDSTTSSFSGTMDYTIETVYLDGANSCWELSIPMTPTLTLSDCARYVDIAVYTADDYLDLQGRDILNATLVMGESITVNENTTSNRCTFEATLSTDTPVNETETNLVSVCSQAQGAATVAYNKQTDEVTATSERPLSIASFTSYVGTSANSMGFSQTSEMGFSASAKPNNLSFANVIAVQKTSITVDLHQKQTGTCIAAVYDPLGRMISCGTADLQDQNGTVTISCPGFVKDAGQSIKIMLVDADSNPLEAPVSYSMSAFV